MRQAVEQSSPHRLTGSIWKNGTVHNSIGATASACVKLRLKGAEKAYGNMFLTARITWYASDKYGICFQSLMTVIDGAGAETYISLLCGKYWYTSFLLECRKIPWTTKNHAKERNGQIGVCKY